MPCLKVFGEANFSQEGMGMFYVECVPRSYATLKTGGMDAENVIWVEEGKRGCNQ